MNEQQSQRLSDETSNALRALHAIFAAALAEETIRFWTGSKQERLTDLDAAMSTIGYALAAYVAYGSEPVSYVATSGSSPNPNPSGFTVRKLAWLARVAPVVARAISGERVEIPESADLGAYPSNEAPEKKSADADDRA